MRVFKKAQIDPFSYAVGLTTGQTIFCESIKHRRGWVTLNGIRDHSPAHYGFPESFTFTRGLDVRAKCIAWIADAGGYDS